MVSQAKIYAVTDLAEKLKTAKTTALIDYQGLTAKQIAELRSKVKEAGGQIQVIKNTLISRALAKVGIELDKPLVGPTALVFANENEIESLKIIDEAGQELEKPEFKLGIYQKKLLSIDQLQKFVKLPGREVLLSQIISGLTNPLSRLVYGLKFNQIKLILMLKEVMNSKGGEKNDG